MIIEPFRMEDMASFLELATEEKWVAEPWEFEFLLAEFSRGCFSARMDNGKRVGFVTSLRHERSGWIGNLIVAEHYRSVGIGGVLFRKALEALQQAGAETVWLTASAAGKALYEKNGFSSIDTIIRWVGSGRQRHGVHETATKQDTAADSSYGLDAHAWGDHRNKLIDVTVRRGRVLQCESGFIVRQPCGDAVQFGPYSARDAHNAERLFDDASETVASGAKILLDAPASNQAALRLFNRRKMRIAGSTELMYAGTRPDYRPELIYGLATMGSCG